MITPKGPASRGQKELEATPVWKYSPIFLAAHRLFVVKERCWHNQRRTRVKRPITGSAKISEHRLVTGIIRTPVPSTLSNLALLKIIDALTPLSTYQQIMVVKF